MEKEPQELDIQLNNTAPAEDFSLEDIMREFGGWSKAEEPAPEPPQEEASSIMRVAAPEPQKESKFKLVDLTGDTVRFTPVTETDLEEEPAPRAEPVEMPDEPEQPEPDREQEREHRKAQKREAKRLRRLASQRKKALRAQRRNQRRNEPEVVYPSPEDACAAYAKGGSLRLRLLAAGGMTVLSLLLLVLGQYPIGSLDLTGNRPLFSVMMLALLLAQSVLSLDVFVRGMYQALKMRFDLTSLLALTVLVTVADAFFAIPAGRTPFCATSSLALLIALRSMGLEKKAKWRTLKTVLSMESPVAAVKEEKAWHDLDCIFYLVEGLPGFRPAEICAMESKVLFKGDHPAGLHCSECPEKHTCPESIWVINNQFAEATAPGDACSFAVDTGNHDSGSALVRFENGVHASYSQNFAARKAAAVRMARVIGFKATLEFDFHSGELKVIHHQRGEVEVHSFSAGAGHYGGDFNLMDDFYRMLTEGIEPCAGIDAGLTSALCCLRARQSCEEKVFRAVEYAE